MKIYFLLLIACVSMLPVFAQNKYKDMPEKERKALEKEWKAKLKKMDVLEYKQLSEEFTNLRRDAGSMSGQIREAAKVLEEKDKTAANLRSQIDSIRSLASGRAVATDENEVDIANNSEFNKGAVFKVQVGVSKKIDPTVFEGEDIAKFAVEKDPDGRLVYTLGYFRDKADAKNFQENLSKVGLKDTYMVFYKDGKRANVTEIAEPEPEKSGSDW